jgi:hypothetical protein
MEIGFCIFKLNGGGNYWIWTVLGVQAFLKCGRIMLMEILQLTFIWLGSKRW